MYHLVYPIEDKAYHLLLRLLLLISTPHILQITPNNILPLHRLRRSLSPPLNLPTPPRKITNMLVLTLLTQPLKRLMQLKQIIPILPTRAPTHHDFLGQRLRILRAEELRVIWQADVDKTPDLARDSGTGVWSWSDGLVSGAHVLVFGWREGRVLDAVAVDLADVEVLFDFCDVRGGDAVGGSPDTRRCGRMLVG